MAEHWSELKSPANNKYKVLAEAAQRGMKIRFDILYKAKGGWADLENELGQKESEYIRKYLPPLNFQIPKADNWKSYTINPRAQIITLDEIIKEKGVWSHEL